MSFRPEFLNRLDEILLFKPLTKSMIGDIVSLIVADLNKRLEERNIKVELTDAAKDKIIEAGFDPVYGARPLKRYIQRSVENISARLILSGEIGEGDTICIDDVDRQLVGRKK